MYHKILCFSFSFCIVINLATSQETWTLERCVQHAQQNSLQMKQAEISVKQARLSEQENRNERYPTLNASYGGNLNVGRTIDPTTNSFTSESTITNSVSLNAGVLLFNGNRVNNSIKQSKIDIKAAEEDANAIANDLSLQVAGAYLQILFDEEQLANSNKRLEQTQAQLQQTDKLIKAGTLPRADRLEILAQIARDEQDIITRDNAVIISYLNLKQLLQLDPDHKLKVEKPTIVVPDDANPDAFTLRNVYAKALNNQPVIRANQLRVESAQLDTDIAKSLRLPTISLFGNLNSFYSNKVPDFENITNPGIVGPGSVEDVLIDRNPAIREIQFFERTGVEFGKRQYFDQLNDNFGQGIGVNINIPIYNQNRTSIALERAELNIMSTQIADEQSRQQLKTDIQRAIADARAAKKQYEAAQKTVEALDAAYSNTEKRHQLGDVNTFEYTTAKNSLDQAAVDLIIAKYNYLYTLKVVDFYEGNKIKLRK